MTIASMDLKPKLFSVTITFLAVLLTFTMISCSSSANNSDDSKFNPALKQKMMEAERYNSDELISAFIKTSEELNENMRIELMSTGLRLGSVNELIITAAGTPKQIREAARLEFIVHMELSHIDEIK